VEPSDKRILFQLKSLGAQTSSALGERLGMTSVGARQHLLKLQRAGLVVAEDRCGARGRPKRYWLLSDKGHGRFPDRHSDLTLDLIQSTRAAFGARGLERLIRHREQVSLVAYQSRLGVQPTLKGKVAALAQLREQESYMAEWVEEGDGSFLLIENHCPICAAAATCQALCRSELAIFRAALGAEVAVERLEHIQTGARRCAYRITKRQEAGQS
jgi:predicted ArsR family transcriptional regulator